MGSLFLSILNMSLTAGIIVLFVVLLRLIFKKAPKWLTCGLWALVAFRLVCPFSVESVFSILPSRNTFSAEKIFSSSPISGGTSHFATAISNGLTENIVTNNSVTQIASNVDLSRILSYVWLAGIAVMLIYGAVVFLNLHKKMKTAIHIKDNIFQSEMAETPFILGVFNPKIYLPLNLSDEETEIVLAHETAHIKRKDNFIKPIAFLLLSVYWFNPLIWLGYILLARDIEYACDEKAVSDMDLVKRKEYSFALLSMSVSRKNIAVCPLAFGEVGVKERIKNVLSFKKPAIWIILVALVASIVACLCLLTNPKSSKDIFDKDYRVESVIYDAPEFSFTYTPDTAPSFTFAKDMSFVANYKNSDDNTINFGILKEYELTEENFDECFTDKTWETEKYSAEELRENCKKVYYIEQDSETITDSRDFIEYFMVIEEKDGSLFLTDGYKKDSNGRDSDEIRWVFKLTEYDITDRLNSALSLAIMEKNKSNYQKGEFACESHIILGQTEKDNEIEVYAIALYNEYSKIDEKIENINSGLIPISVTFTKDDNGELVLKEYITAEDGSDYSKSIEKIFPKRIAKNFYAENYSEELIADCNKQAEYHFEITDSVEEATTKENASEQYEQTDENILLGTYYPEGKTPELSPRLKVLENNKMSVIISLLSSYYFEGEYAIKGDSLTVTGDGYYFVFKIKDKNILVYDKENSKPYPSVGDIEDGQRFIFEESN